MTNQTAQKFLTNAEVSARLGRKPSSIRSLIHRAEKGESTPSFPKPEGKIAGAWIWDRKAFERHAKKHGLT